MKRLTVYRALPLCGFLLSCLIVSGSHPARADDDWRWREHERREHEWREHLHHEREEARRHEYWDHRYWDYDNGAGVDVYRPPAVVYAPPPPNGLDFVFHVR